MGNARRGNVKTRSGNVINDLVRLTDRSAQTFSSLQMNEITPSLLIHSQREINHNNFHVQATMSGPSLSVSRGDIHKSGEKKIRLLQNSSTESVQESRQGFIKSSRAGCVASHTERQISMAVVDDCYLKSVCKVVTVSVGGVFGVHKMALCAPLSLRQCDSLETSSFPSLAIVFPAS